jgi:hypothetical protein
MVASADRTNDSAASAPAPSFKKLLRSISSSGAKCHPSFMHAFAPSIILYAWPGFAPCAAYSSSTRKEHPLSNPFVHLELCTPDTVKAKEFYAGLFGWEFTDNDMGGGMIYSTFKPDSGPGGGLFSMPGVPTFWLAYVGVEDINAATEKAKSLGATIHKGPDEIPNVGWFTILVDTTGATIALFQPNQPM